VNLGALVANKTMKMVLGIGGISQAGKSTLAERLRQQFLDAGRSCVVLSQDDFVKPAGQFPMMHDMPDWEHPDSMDWEKMLSETQKAVKQHEVVIVEGIFAFSNPKLNALYTHKYLLEIDFDTFISRRRQDTRWGETPEWYYQHVWGSYFKIRKPDGAINLPSSDAIEALLISFQ
jgi:nicotinamide/nicotinate riboside kinase